jgi:hypothetical protein
MGRLKLETLEVSKTLLDSLLHKEGSKITKKCSLVNKHLSRYFKFGGYFFIRLKV